MTLTLELPPELASRLQREADRTGLPLPEVALRRLAADPPQTPPQAPAPGSLAELFAQWREEDATVDPEELARRDAELEELKANLNANRAANGERPLFR